MIKLVLVRHGQSVWNLENKFTGWTDVELSEQGIKEAKEAGKILKEQGFHFDLAFTSVLKRAENTLDYILKEMGEENIEIKRSWKLNERHYGALQGLNKDETKEKYGEKQVLLWRRSTDVRPPELEETDERYPGNDPKYKDLTKEELPKTENLVDTIKRVLEYWNSDIKPELENGKRIIIAAHGNSLRGLIKYLDNISDEATSNDGQDIPIILICYKLLGKQFFLRSIKTMLISNILMDWVVPLFPIYQGDMMLSCICMSVFSGIGYALIYMRDTSTGGADFVLMAIHKAKPHISVGRIIIVMDFIIVIIGGILMHGNIDKIIYGLIGTYILSFVVDKLMYGVDAGKLALIVTEKGPQIAAKIDELSQRGATLIKAEGSYTGREKEVLMCACNNKEMYTIQEAVKKVDSSAFLVTMESNEVRGKGFKPI